MRGRSIMKKYIKPTIMLERYDLSQNIAACAWVMNNSPEAGCVGEADEENWGTGMDGFLFADSCNYHVNDFGGYCYQNSADGTAPIFNS